MNKRYAMSLYENCRIAVAMCILLLVNVCWGQDWKQELDSVLTILEEDALFDGQVLIAEGGEVVFYNAYGHLPEGNTRIAKDTPLAVKSVTKAFTAAAILTLEQEGKLNLNDEVQGYLPGWPYRGITIRQLLSMTSGLPDFLEQAVHMGDTTEFMSNRGIVDLVSRYPVEVNPPGEAYDYQNSNYITLAAIVEHLSGMAYEDYVAKSIFGPLNLEHTYLEDLTRNASAVNGDNFYAPSGEGNLYSTAGDLFKFEQAFYHGVLLSMDNTRATFTKTRLHDGSTSKYGLAWWVMDEGPEEEYYILGDGPNIRASIQRYPETRSTLIYIHNVTGRYWKDVYWVVRNIWFGDQYTMPVPPETLERHAIDTSLYAAYVGSYLTPGFGLLHITQEHGKLYLRPDPIPGKEELVPSSDTTFYFRDQSVEWEFFLDPEGNVIGFGSRGQPGTMGPPQE